MFKSNQTKIPLTSTHRCVQRGIYLRVNNEVYVDQYCESLQRWFQCYITNEEVLITNRKKYVKLLHTGYERMATNFYQWSVGSMYRVKKLKMEKV